MDFMKCEIFVPEEFEEQIIQTLNEYNLLSYNGYDSVYSKTPIVGHWRPLEGSTPYDGKVGELSTAHEIKLEFRIKTFDREFCERLLREIHPYEEPIINFLELL